MCIRACFLEKVAEEVQAQYPDVVFLVTASGGRLSGEGQRSGIDHTQNLLSDLFHLAKCDFFVGTGSSQVSRYAPRFGERGGGAINVLLPQHGHGATG